MSTTPTNAVSTRVVVYYQSVEAIPTTFWAVRNGTQRPPRDYMPAYIVGSSSADIIALEPGLPAMPGPILGAALAAAWVNDVLDGTSVSSDGAIAALIAIAIQDDRSSSERIKTVVAMTLNHRDVATLEQHRKFCDALVKFSDESLARELANTRNLSEEKVDFWTKVLGASWKVRSTVRK
jgi:hypothetical protein